MDESEAAEGLAALLAGVGVIIALIVLAIVLAVTIFYLLTLQKALNRCAPQNRAMSPGLVWLQLVPLFNIVWQFFVVLNIAKSLESEFKARNIPCEAPPGKGIGLAMCILVICGMIPFVNFLAGPAALVCWIIYWVKIAGFSAKLA